MKQLFGVALLALTLIVSPAWAGKYSNGSGKSVQTKSTSSAPRSSSSSGSSDRTSGTSTTVQRSSSNVGSKPKPSGNNSYDASAAADQRAADSQRKWEAYQRSKQQQAAPAASPNRTAPQVAPAYVTPNGHVKEVDHSDASYWKGRLDQSKVEHRNDRRRFFYASQYDYYHSRPRVFYDDPYDSDFWWWLRGQPTYVQAQWAYNHRYDMDQRRYGDLMLNAAIAASVIEMENNRAARNRYWAPSGVDPDLMMSDTYVQQVTTTTYAPAPVVASSGGGHGFFVFVCVLFFICLTAVLIWGAVYFFRNRGEKREDAMFGLKSKPKPPTAKTLQNPLKIEEGQYLNLTTLDEDGLQFQVRSISEWDRVINGHTHKFTDYSLVAQQPGTDAVRMRLRMNPTAEKALTGLSQRILKLQLMDEMEFDPEFYEMIGDEDHPDKDDQGNDVPDFVEKNDDDTVKAQWWRINGVRGAYTAEIDTVGLDNNGQHTTSHQTVEFRDYSRTITGESGHDQAEYLFVEIDHTNGRMIQIWKGVEVDESEVHG